MTTPQAAPALRLEAPEGSSVLQPLQPLVVRGATGGTLVARDGAGREYFRGPASDTVTLSVGGAPGTHRVEALDEKGEVVASATFPMRAETRIDDGGPMRELLAMLTHTMVEYGEQGTTLYRGRVYRFFVRWLRDHVHALKGMKHFAIHLKDGIDLYRDTQREDGMIWDNVYPRGPEPNYWDHRFAEGDFIRPYDDFSAELKRIPAEADVEYLFVEGLYFTWKATGDDAWMHGSLDAAIRALRYARTDPYRWSQVHQLVKRGYTIDTWDFQAEEDRTEDGDPMRVHPERTRFGIMFGDNTGYAAACRQLAQMLSHAGRVEEAEEHLKLGEEVVARLDALSWTGTHYRHHVPEDPSVRRDLGVDEAAQVSLSNAYSLNRGIERDKALAIIASYERIKENLPPGSPGEWYTIYPPFGRGFGGHSDMWQYMNAGVTPIVAGELARGAFEHGREAYGADILQRLLSLAKEHSGRLHCAYTGSIPEPPERTFRPLDLRPYANADTAGTSRGDTPGWTGEGENDLHEMPTGEQTFAGVTFLVPDPSEDGRGAAILSTCPGYAGRVEVPVGAHAGSVYFLHAVSKTGLGGLGGKATLRYADGLAYSVRIVRGENAAGWWMPEAKPGVMEVAWRGRNVKSPNVGLVAYGLTNPHPEREIEAIELEAADDGAFWMVLGLSLCDAPAFFPPSPISFGIPDSWGAAAVVYALVEGLAGVADAGTVYDHVRLSPRWSALGEDEAEVCVAYPESGGYAAYRYRYRPQDRAIELTVTGSGERCDVRLLLPSGAASATVEAVDGAIPHDLKNVEGSPYATFALPLPGPHTVTVRYGP